MKASAEDLKLFEWMWHFEITYIILTCSLNLKFLVCVFTHLLKLVNILVFKYFLAQM